MPNTCTHPPTVTCPCSTGSTSAPLCADGGTTWTDLTGFQRDLLRTIRRCERDDPIPTGQTVKEYLADRYTEPINNGRLYQNLNHLIECGLIEKGFVDGRTNTYHLADEAIDMLDRTVHQLADDCGVDVASGES